MILKLNYLINFCEKKYDNCVQLSIPIESVSHEQLCVLTCVVTRVPGLEQLIS